MTQEDLKPALKELGFQLSDVPDQLYKYTGCGEGDREKKLEGIAGKKVWLSYAKFLNDPFEGLALYVDKFKLTERGWGKESVDELYRALKKLGDKMLVGSFAASGLKEDMPLWAHYAYDHQGYCLEYRVISEKSIYPVLYENRRHLAAKTLNEFLTDLKRMESTEESLERFLVIWSSFMIKHKVWEYEKEYRILKYDDKACRGAEREARGCSLGEEELGIALRAIYMGEKCSCKEELIAVGKVRNCEVYEMVFNPYEEEFKLTAKKCLSPK